MNIDGEDAEGAVSDDSFDSGSEVDMDDTEDFIVAGKKKQKTKQAAKTGNPTTKALKKGGKSAGEKRTASTSASAKKRKTAAGPVSVPRRMPRVAISKEDLKIKDDVPLFNAIKNPENALQATAEDWIVAYQTDPGPALTEMINFVLRCCACNASVDETLVRDLDNVVDSAQEIQDQFKTTAMPSYPIISGSEEYKKFKKSLSEFISRLLTTASESELLLTAPTTAESPEDVVDSPLIDVLKEWLSTLSSSAFRAFRHTATFVVLNIVEGLAGLLVEKRKALNTTKKQRDAEKKKARPDANRVKQLEERWQTDKAEDRALIEAVRDLIDGVFVYRFKDADFLIRTDCTAELGKWIKTYPDIFLKNEYIHYLGVSLSDQVPQVRMAAVKALLPLYARSAFPDPLIHFTTVHKEHMIQMVVLDSDVSVRVHAIETLNHIDRRGLLDNIHRDKVGVHVFDEESRVRGEVAYFVKCLVEDEVAEVADEVIGPEPASLEEAKRDASAKEKRERWESEVEKLRLKLLAKKLVHYQNYLSAAGRVDPLSDVEGGVNGQSTAADADRTASDALDGEQRIGRAIKALWDFDDLDQPLSGWTELVELLLYDHSAEGNATPTASARVGRGRGRTGATNTAASNYSGNHPPNAAYNLVPEEETVLLEALVAIVEQIKHRAENAKPVTTTKQEEDPAKSMHDDLTRFLIPKLPELFAKYRTESRRVAEVLLLLPLVDMNLFASTGQASVLAKLWDEVTTQMTRHSESSILNRGALAVHTLTSSTKDLPNLSEVATTKLLHLQESLVSALREPLRGQEAATSALDQDTIFTLDVNVQRLMELVKVVDCCEVIEDTEAGQVSSGWEIVREVALRAKLGYAGEESMISGCLTVMYLHLAWKLRTLVSHGGPSAGEEEGRVLADDILVKRNEAREMMESLIASGSSAAASVKSVAADRLLLMCQMFHCSLQADVLAAQAHEERLSAAGEGAEVPSSYVPQVPGSLDMQLSSRAQEDCVAALLAEVNSVIAETQAEDEEASTNGEAADRPTATTEQDEDDAQDQDEDAVAGTDAAAKKAAQDKDKRPAAEGSRPESTLHRLRVEKQLFDRLQPVIFSMRLGLVDLRLSVPIIAKYRRAGPFLDALIKSLFDDLREAALMGGDRKMAVEVILASLKECFETFLSEGSTQSMDNFVALSKSLSSVLVLRGPQLTIVRSLDVAALLDLHQRGCEYVAKKWKAAERANAKSIKARAPVFWKGLVNLLLSATPRDALRIKAAMDTALQKEDIEVPSASKAWDGQRQYEKKLVSIIARNKTNAAMPPPAARPGPAAASATPRKGGADQRMRESTTDLLHGPDDGPLSSPAPSSRPRPRAVGAGSDVSTESPVRSSQKRKAADSDDGEESELSDVE